MHRREFFAIVLGAAGAGLLTALGGCAKKENAPRFGNQEKLWNVSTSSEKLNEPLELAYAKNTPAVYRDASFGKEDPNFKPKVGGG